MKGVDGNETRRNKKDATLAAQSVTGDQLKLLFHLPLSEAADEVGVRLNIKMYTLILCSGTLMCLHLNRRRLGGRYLKRSADATIFLTGLKTQRKGRGRQKHLPRWN
jgi:hypothetical protein